MGSYVESNLMSGETVTYRAQMHWIIFVSLKAVFTLFLAPIIEKWSSEFAVTNKRVIIKVGLISRRTVELNLGKIESIGVDQSIFGRILSYGTIIVMGTGGTKEPFRGIANPMDFRKAVNEAVESAGPGRQAATA